MTTELQPQPPKEQPLNSDQKSAKSRIFSRELFVRSISAVILAVGALYLTHHSFTSFIALAAIIALVMVWEWGKLTNNDTPLQLVIPAITILTATTAFLTNEWPLFAASLIAGGFLAVWSTHYWWRSKWALKGLFYVGAPTLALLYLRRDAIFGFEAVLYVFLIVWATDTAAYFSGRYFGGKKLAPAISPGKTWSGTIGGLFAGLLTGALFAISLNSEPIILALIGLLLSAVAQIGDLAESAIKRHFGVKDSSHIIPGHGGILDRLDGIVVAATVAAIIGGLHDFSAPGHGLLVWFA